MWVFSDLVLCQGRFTFEGALTLSSWVNSDNLSSRSSGPQRKSNVEKFPSVDFIKGSTSFVNSF